MSDQKQEILAECHIELNALEAPNSPAAHEHLEQFYDELLGAIKRDAGIRESESPLPASSDAAARFGVERQLAGVPVTHVPRLFQAISQSLGKVGEKYELQISAEEYKILNLCLDAGLATSIENFWQLDRDRENRLITERFGFMAHDLRNALSNTNLAFKLLRAGDLDIQGRTADVVARNLLKMEALVAQCLGSVQLAIGIAPELVPVHVASALRELEAAALPDRNINIQLELDEQLYIAADELLLNSALSNLLHNAVKFSAAHSTVRLSANASDGMVVLEVRDECGGLKHDKLSEIFEPYVKGREGNQKGSGLGLAIVKRAVEAMKGQLSVTDVPGVGCIFTARFPLLMRH